MSKSANRNLLRDKQHVRRFFTSKRRGKLLRTTAADLIVRLVASARYIAPDQVDDDEKQIVDLTQTDIKSSVDLFSAQKRFDLELPLYGSYRIDYTRNGR